MRAGIHENLLNSGAQKISSKQETSNKPLQPPWLQGVVHFATSRSTKLELYRHLQMHIPTQTHILQLLPCEIHTVLLPR